MASDTVKIDPMTTEAKFQKSEFAAVIFHTILETYPADAHVECCYTITSDLVPSSRDWVGLYKVGWMSSRNYIYYDWAPKPEGRQPGKDCEASVLFQAHNMPGDDGEFYQFCYVSSSGQIRGASTPFQFKKPTADDFVELEDSETDMLIIRSKTVFLEEKLKQSEDDSKKMVEIQTTLETERETLVSKLCMLTKQLSIEQEKTASMQQLVKRGKEKVSDLTQEAHDMNTLQEELLLQVTKIQQEKELVEVELKKLKDEIMAVKLQCREMCSERDELVGQIQTLKEQKELYKTHALSTESTTQSHLQELLSAQDKLRAVEESLVIYTQEITHLEAQLGKERKSLLKQQDISSEHKVQNDEMTEKVRDAEDKLTAVERTKQMVSEELNMFRITQRKMSQDLESSKNESHNLKIQLSRLEEEFSHESDVLKAEILSLNDQLDNDKQVREKLSQEKSSLSDMCEAQQETCELSKGSLYALQTAQESLKERYAKLKQRYEDMREDTKRKEAHYRSKEQLVTRENADLKDRIVMCRDEYKILYKEKGKLQKKYEHYKGKSIKATVLSAKSASCEVENMQKSVASTTGKKDGAEAEDDTQNQLELLEGQKEILRSKKEYYKKLYNEEKDKQDVLRKHYYEEIEKAHDAQEHLKKRNEELEIKYDLKLRSLQNFLSQKDKEIEELNEKLRGIKEKEDEAPTSPPVYYFRSGSLESYIPPRVLMYGNPYAKESTDIKIMEYPKHVATVLQGPPQMAPLVYPDAPVLPPRQPISKPLSDPDAMTDGNLDTPLTPLPPPMKPQVTQAAKLAALYAVIQGDGDTTQDDIDLKFEDASADIGGMTASGIQLPEEDRYMDAAGEAMKICPTCNITFSPDTIETDFMQHCIGHFGKICPFCYKQVDETTSDQEFEKHVEEHIKPDPEETNVH